MAIETKMVLIAIANIMRLSGGNMKVAYEAVREMANADGIELKPLEEVNDNEPKRG